MAKKQTIDLPPPQNKILQKILRQHIPNKTVWAFGSRVEWKASETSDLDLVAHKCSGAEIADLKEALEESALHCSVDMLNWEDIPDSFRANIKKHYVVVQQNTVPEGWRVVKLGEIPIEIIDGDRGKNYPKKAEFIDSGYCLFLNTKNVTGKGFAFAETNFITKEKDNTLRKGKLKRNDIVLTTRGTIGNVAFYSERVPFDNIRINSGMVIIRPNGIDPQFNFQLFKYLRDGLLKCSSGSAQPQLPIRDMKELQVLLPSLPEQKAIAEVLSNLDDHIDIVGQIIEKKRMIRQGMMQQLLTRKIRLPGFSGEWETKALGDIATITGAGVDKKIVPGEVKTALLNYMDVFKKNYLYKNQLHHEVSSPEHKLIACNVLEGDIFITPSSETRNDIAVSALAMEDMNGVVYSYHINRIRFKTHFDKLFRLFMLKTDRFMSEASKMCEGSGTRYVISLQKFRHFKVSYPKAIKEQTAIATVLSDIDAEIAALEAKKAKAMQIKQGAMQQLLTGKIRLTADTAQKIADII